MSGRIVHIGVGNFHRAHQAWYTNHANAAAGTGWTITGVSLRRPDVRDALKSQDWRYTLAISDAAGSRYETIDVIDNILVAPEDPGAVVAAIADPAVALVTSTVTEKGYHLEPATHRLDIADPAVRADLNGSGPTTIVGFLAAGLAARREAQAGPVTVLCSDNLPDNGRVLREAVLAFAAIRHPGLADWIETHATFPCSMVDRITPATSDALRQQVAAATGFHDAWPVATERFSQWVIEDRFAGPRPDWDAAGAEFVDDVAPYEIRKLRMLNGAHSTLAYLGTLAGHEFVHEAIADQDLAGVVRAVMDEAAGTIPEVVRADAPDYAAALMERFANPGLSHALRQICMDGSQKVPIRIVNSLRDRLKAGSASPALEKGLAGWLAFVIAETDAGRALDDGLAAPLADLCRRANDDRTAAAALLSERQIFGSFASDWPGAASRIAATAAGLVPEG